MYRQLIFPFVLELKHKEPKPSKDSVESCEAFGESPKQKEYSFIDFADEYLYPELAAYHLANECLFELANMKEIPPLVKSVSVLTFEKTEKGIKVKFKEKK